MEPRVKFGIAVDNGEREVGLVPKGYSASAGGFIDGAKVNPPAPFNVIFAQPMGGVLTPDIPLRLTLRALTPAPIRWHHVLHQTGEQFWAFVPERKAPGS
jgi:hypothetical protein